MGNARSIESTLHRLGLALAVAVFTGFSAAALAGTAGAARVEVLGAARPASSSCDPERCFVEARVTGFQTRIGSKRKPFVSPFPGRVVAWSIKLGKPSKEANTCFTSGCDTDGTRFDGFGGPARARIAILQPIRKDIQRGKPNYKILRQSRVEDLAPFFGGTATFALKHPLKIGRGQIVALTIPTWAPVFADGLSSTNTWRASRRATKARGGCTIKDSEGRDIGANVRAGGPHIKRKGKSGVRYYGCTYSGNRLLYSATVVRRPKQKS